MSLDTAISFRTERFDYTSDLPAEYNAGNRFHGRDVAEYLADRLNANGLHADFLDEDWGWLVLGRAGTSTQYEMAVYNVNEHGEGCRPGAPEWGLWIRAFERTRLWGLVPRRREVAVPATLLQVVTSAIEALGAAPSDWIDGPGR